MKTILNAFAVSALFTFALLCICAVIADPAVVADPTIGQATPELQPTAGIEVTGKTHAMTIPHLANFRRNIINTKPVVVRATNVVVGSARKAATLPYMMYVKSDIVGHTADGKPVHKLPKYNKPERHINTYLPTNATGIKNLKF